MVDLHQEGHPSAATQMRTASPLPIAVPQSCNPAAEPGKVSIEQTAELALVSVVALVEPEELLALEEQEPVEVAAVEPEPVAEQLLERQPAQAALAEPGELEVPAGVPVAVLVVVDP